MTIHIIFCTDQIKTGGFILLQACRDFLELAETHSRKWHRALQYEREQRVRLEETIEQLAKQHNSLERACRGAPGLSSNTTGIPSSVKGKSPSVKGKKWLSLFIKAKSDVHARTNNPKSFFADLPKVCIIVCCCHWSLFNNIAYYAALFYKIDCSRKSQKVISAVVSITKKSLAVIVLPSDPFSPGVTKIL